MADGVLIIDKPSEWTSQDVCAKLRGVFHEKRIGHGGTLDPMATGVLPVFVGRATRAVEFVMEGEKEYVAGLRLGLVTNTQDTTGEVLEQRPVSVTRAELEAALERFRGDILQVPPMYSAIKIGGKKLYELARKGKEVERPPRKVTIHALELLDERPPRSVPIRALEIAERTGERDFSLRVRCSKGTYVRALCHDIGAALGCGGCMSSLRRTMASGFTLAQSHPLEEVLACPDPAALLLPVDGCFADLPRLDLPPKGTRAVRNGQSVPRPGLAAGEYRLYDGETGEFLALARAEQGRLVTVKSFFAVK